MSAIGHKFSIIDATKTVHIFMLDKITKYLSFLIHFHSAMKITNIAFIPPRQYDVKTYSY